MYNLTAPTAYQGGKQRLATQILDIIDDCNGTFYDLCCGSGSIGLSYYNQRKTTNIHFVDISGYGYFYQQIANNQFSLDIFKSEIDKLPQIDKIQGYLKELSSQPINEELKAYHYLLLQAGAFGSKQIAWRDNKWINCTFRSYWLPTKTSNRKSPVNPMMPMPTTLYQRVEDIVQELSGKINATNIDLETFMQTNQISSSDIIYFDPPYENTTGYCFKLDIAKIVDLLRQTGAKIYISHCTPIPNTDKQILLNKGRNKGNILGTKTTKPCEEWLSILR